MATYQAHRSVCLEHKLICNAARTAQPKVLQSSLIAIAMNDSHDSPFPQVVQLLLALGVVASVHHARWVGMQ
jgi:hypothetical protein